MKIFERKHAKGFTLAESIIALGILVVLITGFLAVFGPAADSIRKTLSAEEASRLQQTLQGELTILRGDRERREYEDDSFRKAFDWISRSHSLGGSIILYKYRANPTNTREDGTMNRYDRQDGIAGQDFVIQPMARRINDPLLEEDLESVEGRVFLVKLSQLVNTDGSWETTADPELAESSESFGTIVDPYERSSRDFSNDPEEFPEAVVALQAGFYALPTNSFQFLSSLDPTRYTRPVFTRNLAVLR